MQPEIVLDDNKLEEYKTKVKEGMYAHLNLEEDTNLWLRDGRKITLKAGPQAFQITDIIRLNSMGECAVLLAIDGKNRYTNKVESAEITVSLNYVEELIYIH